MGVPSGAGYEYLPWTTCEVIDEEVGDQKRSSTDHNLPKNSQILTLDNCFQVFMSLRSEIGKPSES